MQSIFYDWLHISLMKRILLCFLIVFYSCKNDKKEFDESYPFTGTLLKKFDDKNQMLIDHEEVPGFMEKMVMMFNIDSSINLNQFNIGDSLNFNFYVSYQDEGAAKTWASELQIVGHRELNDNENYDDFFDEGYSIDIGEKLSDGTFTDTDGNEVKLSDWDGQFKFISFIFSRCPMPNFCPLLISKNQILAEKFKDNKKIKFIILSFDYKYDTPQVLKERYSTITDNYDNIHILSSYNHINDLITITKEAGLGFSGIDEGDEREIGHTLKSIVIDPNGVLVESYSGDDWDPQKVGYDIIDRMKIYK